MKNKEMKIYTFLGSEYENGRTANLLKAFERKAKSKGFVITDNLRKADALFIVTPTHWFGAPIKLKRFIDTTLHELEEDFSCENKYFGALVYAPEGGASLLLSQIALTANLMGFKIPPYSLTYYRYQEEKWALNFDFLDFVQSNPPPTLNPNEPNE